MSSSPSAPRDPVRQKRRAEAVFRQRRRGASVAPRIAARLARINPDDPAFASQRTDLIGEIETVLFAAVARGKQVEGLANQPSLQGGGFIPGQQSPRPTGRFGRNIGAGRKTVPGVRNQNTVEGLPGVPIGGGRNRAEVLRAFGGQVPQRLTTVLQGLQRSRAIDPLSRVGGRGTGRGRSGRPDQAFAPSLGGIAPVGSSTVLGV